MKGKFKEKKKKKEQQQSKQMQSRPQMRGKIVRSLYFWIPVIAFLLTIVIEFFNHKTFTTGFASFINFITINPLAFVVDYMLVLVTLVPAIFFRRRIFWCVFVSIIWIVAGGVNGFILMNRMTPFTTADLTVLNTGLDTLPNYLSLGYIILLGVCICLMLGALVYLFIKGKKCQEKFLKRLLKGVIGMVLVLAVLMGCWKTAFKAGQLSTSFANLAFAYEDYGFPFCFLETWLNKGIRMPKGYSQEDILRIRDMIQSNYADVEKQEAMTDTNVLYIQLESFMDPTEIHGLETNVDPIPFWHEMEKQYSTGYLGVPVVGAGTANTEFEMLTGMASKSFGPGEYPYKTCLQEKTVESIAYDLSELGYATHAIHNHRAAFYGRNEVYAHLGFNDFTSLEYMPRTQKTQKGWCKDYVLTDEINKALDSTPDQPDLVYTVSVQGHGSYPTEEVLENPYVRVRSCPENVNSNAMEYYLNQLYEMDCFLRNLTESLEKRKEKTVLILYGDHLPSLNLNKDNMKSGTLYETNYIVWNNCDLKKNDGNMFAYQLSACVLKELHISRGLIMKLHQFSSEELTYYTDLKKLQYDVLYGKHYLYGSYNPYIPTDMRMGISDITLDGMFKRDDYWYVRGSNFSPFCKITMDGDVLETKYVNPSLLRLKEDPGTMDYHDLYVRVMDKHKLVLSDTELD